MGRVVPPGGIRGRPPVDDDGHTGLLGVISDAVELVALLWGGADAGMRMQMSPIPRAAHAGHAEIYLRACMIVVFLLTGCYLERRAHATVRATRVFAAYGRKEVTLVRIDPETGERTESVVPARLQVGDLFGGAPARRQRSDHHHRGVPPWTPPS